MPRFPSSARAEYGCNRRFWLIREGSYRSGTHNPNSRFRPEGGPRLPHSSEHLDRQPGISGRIGEADSAQPTRNDPCHIRLGFGLDSGLISPRWCACAVRYARLVLVAPFLEERPHI